MNKFTNYMGGGEILGVGGGVEDEEDEEPLFQVSDEEGETPIQMPQDEMHPAGGGSRGGVVVVEVYMSLMARRRLSFNWRIGIVIVIVVVSV